jgi:hypothetical protein
MVQSQIQIAKVSKREFLAQTIAQEFNDVDNLIVYRRCLKKYPLHIVYRAYAESKAVPAEQIRKSHKALFFYLNKKYAHERNKNTVH